MRMPRAYRGWLSESGVAGLAHALAMAVGEPDRHWAQTGLALFDPARRGGPPLPPLPEPARVLELGHPRRKALGAYYTPPAVADHIAAATLSRSRTGSVLLDPACGAGAFLLAALRAGLPWRRLRGIDLDPLAVALARAQLAVAAGLDQDDCRELETLIVVGDALDSSWPAADVVLTNPPFLNRLKSLTAASPALAARIRSRHSELVGPYTDISVVFLAECLRHCPVVGIVLPASAYAARDSAALRAATPAPRWAWTLPGGAFPEVGWATVASVYAPGEGTMRLREIPPAVVDQGVLSHGPGLIAADDVAPPPAPASGAALGEVATVEADFRDEYYALQGHVREDAPGLRVVTSGLVDPGRLRWGEVPATIHRQRWTRPTVPVTALHPRQRARSGPQVLVATQTRVIEAAPDPGGHCVGITPVLVARPQGIGLADLLAVLLAPSSTAWALGCSLGSALSLDAIKLSASQLRALPMLPVSPGARALATQLVEGRYHRDAILALGRAMSPGRDDLFRWWARRLPPVR
ncbi:MAG: N-6 DNA methylase [Deltaproteobacteria bacterium]|nr:N-6 DNA methylase [Deltaproteobacteria bacterium]